MTVEDSLTNRRPPGPAFFPQWTYCLDKSFSRSVATDDTLTAEVRTLALHTGAFYLNAGFPCVVWPTPARPTLAMPATGYPYEAREPTAHCCVDPLRICYQRMRDEAC